MFTDNGESMDRDTPLVNQENMSLLDKVKILSSTMSAAEVARKVNRSRQRISLIASQHGIVFAKDGRKQPRKGTVVRQRIEGIRVTNSNAGAAGELVVCSDLLWRGLNVYRSVSPHASADIVVLIGEAEERLRVEVRCGVLTEDGEVRYSPPNREFDILAVVTGTKEIRYFGPHAYRIPQVEKGKPV
jgi:hypothetical protein